MSRLWQLSKDAGFPQKPYCQVLDLNFQQCYSSYGALPPETPSDSREVPNICRSKCHHLGIFSKENPFSRSDGVEEAQRIKHEADSVGGKNDGEEGEGHHSGVQEATAELQRELLISACTAAH